MTRPENDPSDFGLSCQPMLHVQSMRESVRFLEALGGDLLFGSRDGDWSLIRFGQTTLSVLAHPPSPQNPEPLELQFVAKAPLETIEAAVRQRAPEWIERETADEAFGRMLQLRTPDGLVVKILELDRSLIEGKPG